MTLAPTIAARAEALVAGRLGLEFTGPRRADLERGLVQAARACGLRDPEAYLARLDGAGDTEPEWSRLAAHLTVGETYFFRERGGLDALEQVVLPDLIAARRAQGVRRLRLWSAGCASGEEPYSLAILLDRLLPDRRDWSLTILATDISLAALERARRGWYGEWSLRDTPEWVRDRYFHRRGRDRWELEAAVREMITFAPLNLASQAWPSAVTGTVAMDVILCRNVLMYLTRAVQQAVVARLGQSQVPGGWLVVGAAEGSLELFRPLTPVSFPEAVLYRKDAGPPAALAEPWGPERAGLPPRTGAVPAPPALPAPAAAGSDSLERARTLAGRGELEEAERQCRAVLARDRLDAEAHRLLAAIHQERGEAGPAIEALRRVLYLDPGCAPAHFLLGSILLQRGDRRQGRRCLQAVVGLLGKVPPGQVLAGGDGLTAGRLLEAARLYLERVA